MIKLSNGFTFTFAASSGALAYDGRGWPWEWPFRWLGYLDPKDFAVISKTLTHNARIGNLKWYAPWTSVQLLPNGAVINAVGLTNPGLAWWIREAYPRADRLGYALAPSICPFTADESAKMASTLYGCHVPFVEMNLSCPNAEHLGENVEILKAWRAFSYHQPLILKLSLAQVNRDYVEATKPYIEAYSVLNSVPWASLHEDKSPLARYRHGLSGAVSGPPMRELAIWSVKRIRNMTNLPVVAGGGIISFDDAVRFYEAGAEAFSIGTCFLRAPWVPNQIFREYAQWDPVCKPARYVLER